MAKPLRERPADFFYFIFFLLHIMPTVFMDMQVIYPEWLVHDRMAEMTSSYITISNDPLIGGAMGLIPTSDSFVWFKTFVTIEAFFQLPVFVLGMLGLKQDCRSVYLLLLIYGASTVTTVLPCLAVIIATPSTIPGTAVTISTTLSVSQRVMLLSSYIPFLVVPLIITIDLARRITVLMCAGERALETTKAQ